MEQLKKFDISAFSPQGIENEINRNDLCRITGLSDRVVREEISQARRHTVIISLNGMQGYFRPTESEKTYVEKYIQQEKNRAKSIFWSLRGANNYLKENTNG